ncbi:probably inactive leucine-rich repeat receptor-like protein kinase At5g48380 [Quercus lobata]|uniref:probably inactive leucine-rich repeat receptor-like protein kinase At5g48380 n=1 Tax=Quercus lobata TaxID=97700 RepID=UPI0012483C28|nr:probably inactive leucine-rich repeat receptor-like protein kinase At5g48380 [Quercus lobata]
MLRISQTQMLLNARALVLLHILVCSLLPGTFSLRSGTLSDISCLKSITDSFEDPLNSVKSSWTFNKLKEGSFCGYVGVTCWNSFRVRGLDLANKGLKGEFPRGLVNCSELLMLDLSVPDFVSRDTITSESYVNNSGLCGGPLDCCKNDGGCSFEGSFKIGFKLGFILFCSLVINTYILWCDPVRIVTSYKKNETMPTKTTVLNLEERRKNKGKQVDQITPLPTKGLHQEEIIPVPELERLVSIMNIIELSEATGNFSIGNVIGFGKIGMMYKGVLSNGRPSAIKRLLNSQCFEKQFISELLALGRLRHNNIVPLLGYCIEGKEKLLVYKYISNGNLYDWLHVAKGKHKILEWPLRIKIAMGIVRGLVWLHHKCNFRVVHLNLCSNSILLDQNFEPKISNFGESIISNFGGEMFKNPRGNNIFIGSDVWELGYVKKDVYDFGILLLELIIGKESIEINNYANKSNENLVDWIAHLLNSSDLYNVIDESLIGRGFEDEIFELLRIAYTCLQLFPSKRPTTLELYNTIRIFGERYCLTNDSEILRQSEIATASTICEIVEVEIT